MKYFFTVILFLFSLELVASVVDTQPDYSRVYGAERNPFKDGKAALDLAKESNRHVLIEVGGDWCVYCKIFDRYLKANDEIASHFFATFVLLKVNVSDENPNREFLSAFTPVNGYPYIYITESNGKVIYANDMREMTIKGRPDDKKMQAFIDRWKIKQ